MKYLGIDYGKRKVGLAVSEGELVSPLRVLDSSSLEDALTKVLLVLREENIEQVVVGMAESGESRGMTEKFVKELEKRGVFVIIAEETLSSYRADQYLRENKSKKSRIKKNDAMAARVILEDYLEKI